MGKKSSLMAAQQSTTPFSATVNNRADHPKAYRLLPPRCEGSFTQVTEEQYLWNAVINAK
jgi:hypothetical protein